MFTLPSIALGFVIASLIGIAFYFVFGKGWLRLGIYWLIAVVGFFVGQIITTLVNFSFFRIGSVNVLEATATCLIALFITRAVWRSDPS